LRDFFVCHFTIKVTKDLKAGNDPIAISVNLWHANKKQNSDIKYRAYPELRDILATSYKHPQVRVVF